MVRYALAGDMLGELSRNWWLVLLRGIAAIVFGVLALIWPGLTLVALAVVFGVYALVDAGALAYAAYRSAPGSRAGLVVQAVASALIGLIALIWPLVAVAALIFVIGVWAILTGVAEIVTAVRMRAHITSEWLLIFVGALSIVFGLLLWFWPLEGARWIIFVVGVYAIIFGAVLAVAGFRLRGAAEAFAPPGERGHPGTRADAPVEDYAGGEDFGGDEGGLRPDPGEDPRSGGRHRARRDDEPPEPPEAPGRI
ncbi:HdeD family acid-resistance protein [Nocardiopsis sp. YSL2]|uniref:HdeD family acid-resistance protein n=1 Tax=Nocardiopsis sp. YSL2 TaxID=2939492 RepID=UPI0026F42A6A|nr:HdeD family acid-resistance protein [Nocardiopsis sp. YSL2]